MRRRSTPILVVVNKTDAVDAPTVLVEYAPELRAIESNWPKIKFHALREHAGLVFQQRLDG